MTLVIIGNIDARSIAERISETSGESKRKHETPAPIPTFSPLRVEAVSAMTNAVRQDRLSIMWDAPWQLVHESTTLLCCWRADLAREVLFQHVQQELARNNAKGIGLGSDCRVLFLHAQCVINVELPGDRLDASLGAVARELMKVRGKGLPEEEFNALIAQKSLELQKLFVIYGHTNTDTLISQRLRLLQSQMVGIAPRQYQRLRQSFLSSLNVEMLNQDLCQQLLRDMALVLLQPRGEPKFNMRDLRATWGSVMAPVIAAVMSVETNKSHPEVTGIPSVQQRIS